MKPAEFIKEIKKNKIVIKYEFEFKLYQKTVIVTNNLKKVCDIERYKSPEEAYFIYNHILGNRKIKGHTGGNFYFGRRVVYHNK